MKCFLNPNDFFIENVFLQEIIPQQKYQLFYATDVYKLTNIPIIITDMNAVATIEHLVLENFCRCQSSYMRPFYGIAKTFLHQGINNSNIVFNYIIVESNNQCYIEYFFI